VRSQNTLTCLRPSGTQVAERAAGIAGKFKVIRTELGSTTMDLREFVCSQLEEASSFSFRPETKSPTIRGVELKDDGYLPQYPEQGLLLVVDELDYLRTRKDQELFSTSPFWGKSEKFAKIPLPFHRWVAGDAV